MRAAALCAALTALFAVVLWPSKSFAAIIPACENDFASTVTPPATPDQSCIPADSDDVDNSRVAPICDARGASAVAPPRLRGIADLRFEKQQPCQSTDSLRTAVSPGRGDPPASPPDSVFERAVLPELALLAPAHQMTLLLPPPRSDGPRAGVRHAVYHPPR